jgi:DNA-binding CsgD family transcriptional regulator
MAMKRDRAGGRIPKLDDSLLRRLQKRLGKRPRQLGLVGEFWSGNQLARFLLREYNVRLGPRHCRRLLSRLGTRRGTPVHRGDGIPSTSLAPASGEPPRRAALASDAEKKLTALKRLKRLCSAGLPLEPLVRTLFDLFEDAIPNADNKVFLADSGSNPHRYLMNNSELARWSPIHKHYYIDASPEVSGMRIRFRLPDLAFTKCKPVWHSDELVLPNFYRSAGYYEFLRPLGFHHMLFLVFEDQGEMMGSCPIWRGPDMPPFTRDDLRFAALAAPHIAHGLTLASLMGSRVTSSPKEFVAVPGSAVGTIITDARGHIVAADPEATGMFFQMGIFDGLRAETIESEGLRAAFTYIGRLMREIFDDFTCESPPPAVKVFSHRTGATIKLRGFRMAGIDEKRFFTVLVERGELAQQVRARAVARFGLNPTEIRILDALREDQPLKYVAKRLAIARGTLKSYRRRLSDKLAVPGLAGLRLFAHDGWAFAAEDAKMSRASRRP